VKAVIDGRMEMFMKTVILAGGFGTRISEESHLKPKPMIEIGEQPILWHIMKLYSHYGYNEFVVCCGYKQHVIKEYFADYYLHRSDVTFDFTQENRMKIHSNVAEPWVVTLVDTGWNTMTGGRVKRIQEYIGNEPFMLTYGDGVSDIDINELVRFHFAHDKNATLTTIQPGGRFGAIDIEGSGKVLSFVEKSKEDGGWINGGFMVLNPSVFDLIEGDDTVFEKEPLEALVASGQLMAYMHEGYWQCMDSQRDKQLLDEAWASGHAPWKVW
jgi:glucose-1-phosphate cytidylyltransferase